MGVVPISFSSLSAYTRPFAKTFALVTFAISASGPAATAPARLRTGTRIVMIPRSMNASAHGFAFLFAAISSLTSGASPGTRSSRHRAPIGRD